MTMRYSGLLWLLPLCYTPVSSKTILHTSASESIFESASLHERQQNEKAQWFHDQRVDHFSSGNNATWSQRYYTNSTYFGGPGNVILFICGGEGSMNGLYYPYVQQDLAQKFQGFVLQVEHRFYGQSQPVPLPERITNKEEWEGLQWLTPAQALADYVQIIRHVQLQLGCSTTKLDANYCPVISIGGSYPGFLSAMMRLVHPDVIDIGYSASAPMLFYNQLLPSQYDYYNRITHSTEMAHPGCSIHVKQTLRAAVQGMMDESKTLVDVAQELGLCTNSDMWPDYIDSKKVLVDEVQMVVGYSFANYNMADYPPGQEDHKLAIACHIFAGGTIIDQEDTRRTRNMEKSSWNQTKHRVDGMVVKEAMEKLKQFLFLLQPDQKTKGPHVWDNDPPSCLDLSSQLPSGPNATITSGDWSGVGVGHDGAMWDYQTCTLLVEQIGISDSSMFHPPREWTMAWLQDHCQSRFGMEIIPKPLELAQQWHFNNLTSLEKYASRLLFTNGLRDGWSVGGITQNVSDTVVAVNFPQGAHHSDLSAPSEQDCKKSSCDLTEDIREGRQCIADLLQLWVEEVKDENMQKNIRGAELMKLVGQAWSPFNQV